MRWLLAVAIVALSPGVALARDCLDELAALGVDFRPTRRAGIQAAVQIEGPIAGVEYVGYSQEPLVLDCSLAVSLAQAGRYFRSHGVVRVRYSSAYQRRVVKGSDRLSKHSFGLALDVHEFELASGAILAIKNDYEQGLGDTIDCIGAPLTREGWILRVLDCQISRSGMFEDVLTPDYDAGHFNHFHLEVSAWTQRPPPPIRPAG